MLGPLKITLKNLIAADRASEVFRRLREEVVRHESDLFNDLVLVEAQYNSHKRSDNLGLVDLGGKNRQFATINHALVYLIDRMDEDDLKAAAKVGQPVAQTILQQPTQPQPDKTARPAPQPPPPVQKYIAPDMVFVEGGGFQMGSNNGGDDEKPVHTVRLSDFYIGRYPVTFAEFRAFIKATGHTTDAEREGYSYIYNSELEPKNGINWRHNAQGQPAAEQHPVIHVSWNDATEYCAWPKGVTGQAYRLPTEAEWEYAARGGAHSDEYAYAGSNNIDEVAWYNGNSGMTIHPVGPKKPNELDLYDMSGNVWEWCSDWYNAAYYEKFRNSAAVNPKGADKGENRVLRGGGWIFVETCRSAYRGIGTPTNRLSLIGFRLALQ